MAGPRMIRAPGTANAWLFCSEFPERDLEAHLEMENKRFAENPQAALLWTVLRIRSYLVCQCVPESCLSTFGELACALEDLGNGLRPAILKPRATEFGIHTLPVIYAAGMANASAAITLAGRGRIPEYTRMAANRLQVPQKKLANFRKNLMRRRIRSHVANFWYDLHVKMHLNEDQQIRLEIADMIVTRLHPI